jgi:hypothetical protein
MGRAESLRRHHSFHEYVEDWRCFVSVRSGSDEATIMEVIE